MPKKKRQNKPIPKDFTLDSYANSPKPAVKKQNKSWDQILNDLDVNGLYTPDVSGSDETYPEIVWYLLSRHIDPEDIGVFAQINKTTWAITHQKAFWTHVYDKYCKHSPLLPQWFKIEDEPKTRVIRALNITYDYLIQKEKKGNYVNKPQSLVKHRCIHFDYLVSRTRCTLYFKFKKTGLQKLESSFFEKLGQIDANPEKDVKLLQVNLEQKWPNFKELPQAMGMTLTSIRLGLSRSLCSHKLDLGFISGSHIYEGTLPEFVISIDHIRNMRVYDWWHSEYPYFYIGIQCDPGRRDEDEEEPVLERDFFALSNEMNDNDGCDQGFFL